jgi:membrane-bound lytic murein transglycosylase D
MAAMMWALFILNGINTFAGEPADPFPVYPSIEANIAFWKKVYGTYATSQGIIHDRRNLDIIYEIISLKDLHSPGSARFNHKKVKQVKKTYKHLLRSLAFGKSPDSDEEKRIRALFADNGAQGLLKDAHQNIRVQLGQKDRFQAGIILSGAYVNEIREIFKQYDLPPDLAYLPHVESSFNYEAYSKFGAAGIWQFTRGTGKRYMKIDYTVDERRDPIQATHAAARFLKENHDALGNWPLAITAYNHGKRGMLRAQQSHGDYEAVFNGYNGRTFGFASRNFYSEFLAAREVAKNYLHYFGNLELTKPVCRHTLVIPGYVALQDLAQHFQVDEKTTKKLNPALRPPVFNGQKYVPKGFLFHLPKKDPSVPGYLADIPTDLLKDRQKPSRFYRVQRGDTVSEIARAHKVRMNDLILANNLNYRAFIYVGQNLRIPVPGEKIMLAAVPKANPPQKTEPPMPAPIETTPEKILLALATPEAIVLPTQQTEPAPMPAPVAKAKSKQTLLNAPPKPAEKSLLVNPAVVMGNFSVQEVSDQDGKIIGVIQVEPEETLGHYADWLQIPTQQIRRLNGFVYGKPIHVGQKIKIPFNKMTREMFEEKRYEYHKEMEEDFFAAYNVEKTMTYRIEPGDNVWTLCQKKFDMPFWLLKKYNPKMDFNRLIRSKILTMPVVAKIGEEPEPAYSEDNGEENSSP